MQKTPPKIEPKIKEDIQKLPPKVYCPVCGDKMIYLSLSPEDAQSAVVSGAIQATRVSSSCGVNGVLVLRKTLEGLHLYSLTFWITGATANKNKILTPAEIGKWTSRVGQNQHFGEDPIFRRRN